jgi:hypothetical protein
VRRFPIAAAALLFALVLPGAAVADLDDEQALARKYAPVVRLVEQPEECGPGEPYDPLDVTLLFGESTVALRGPWNPVDLVKIGPAAADLAGLYEYHLDFPGDALEPGCSYERWSRRLAAGSSPTVYAHVATDAAFPGRLALQYWFFYAFNDFNNLHEGDWEMIQLVFDADDAAAALARDPAEVGYSSHEGAERAEWGDDKLELVDGTHPVVFPAAGSHANKYTEALYLGSSAEQGVGCDDTRGPHRELRPVVTTIPSDPAAAAAAFPWLTFEGRWGELQEAFFNGPTGPNLKRQWEEPIAWAEGWRDRSLAVPTSGLFGTEATDFFCGAVERGSSALVRLLRNPVPMLILLGTLLGLVIFAIVRATWLPAAPLRVPRRRTWGQILSAAARMYVRRFPLFLGIGVLLIPVGFAAALLQAGVVAGAEALGVETTGESGGFLVVLVLALTALLALFALGLVQAATVCALVELDSGRRVRPVGAFRLALRRWRALVEGLAYIGFAWVVLSLSALLLPVALWLVVRWSLLAQVVEVEGLPGFAALRRSSRLVRRRWIRVASLAGMGAAIALVSGPLLGALLIVLTDAPLATLNVVAGVVYALALPLVALVTSYLYFDLRARDELEPADERDELPAEITITPA